MNKIINLKYSKGDKVEYILNSGKYTGEIVGFKYIEYPSFSKLRYGITPDSKRIDWVISKNITKL